MHFLVPFFVHLYILYRFCAPVHAVRMFHSTLCILLCNFLCFYSCTFLCLSLCISSCDFLCLCSCIFFVSCLMVLFHKCKHVFVVFRGFVARFVVQLFVPFLMDTVTGYGLDPKYILVSKYHERCLVYIFIRMAWARWTTIRIRSCRCTTDFFKFCLFAGVWMLVFEGLNMFTLQVCLQGCLICNRMTQS